MSENPSTPSEKPYDASQDPDADPDMLENRRPGTSAPRQPAEGKDDPEVTEEPAS